MAAVARLARLELLHVHYAIPLPLGDVDSMAERTLVIMENRELRRRMGRRGREIALEKFSPRSALDVYLQLYNSIERLP